MAFVSLSDKRARSFVAVVRAPKGKLLLGGLPEVKSSRFESAEDADSWLLQALFANRDAGRIPTVADARYGEVLGSTQPPEIPKS